MTVLPNLFYADHSDRGRLRLTGRDRQSFLQGMVTNDVARLMPGEGCYAFQLDATAHVLADMHVLCGTDDLLLDVEPGQAEPIAERLEKYLIMERVRIANVSREMGQFLIGGVRAPAFLAEHYGIAGAENWREGQNTVSTHPERSVVLVARAALTTIPMFEVYTAANELEMTGAVPLSPETLEALRIEAGIARFGIDIDARVLAPETGQQARAISYKKGCYIGQEIVARIDARGHTNRIFVGLQLESSEALPVAETPISGEDGREAGRVTSSAVGPLSGLPIALGYLRTEYAAAGTRVRVGEQSAQVVALPVVVPVP